MAYGYQLDGDGHSHPGESTNAATTAPSAATAALLGPDGNPSAASTGPGSDLSGTISVGAVDDVEEQAGHALGADLEPSAALRVVDTVRLFNSTELGRVLNERQLHRHRVRSGRVFVKAPRKKYSRIQVLRYIAWLAQFRHLAAQAGPLQGSVTNEGIARLLEIQAYRCALTGRPLQPEDASLDHIVPVSRGGPHRMENVQVLHTAVNRAKAALTTAEFVSLCREVAAWADQPRDQEHAHV